MAGAAWPVNVTSAMVTAVPTHCAGESHRQSPNPAPQRVASSGRPEILGTVKTAIPLAAWIAVVTVLLAIPALLAT